MSTDPYVPSRLEDRPRQLPNLAPGVVVPPAGSWRSNRPGDLGPGRPRGTLLGSPGPNVGYGLTLAERAADGLHLGPAERRADAVAVVGELAMRRAASFGRAPVMGDVEFAMALLGYDADAGVDVLEWRPAVVLGAHHDYVARRWVVDAVPADVLRIAPADLVEQLPGLRAALRQVARVRTGLPSLRP